MNLMHSCKQNLKRNSVNSVIAEFVVEEHICEISI